MTTRRKKVKKTIAVWLLVWMTQATAFAVQPNTNTMKMVGESTPAESPKSDKTPSGGTADANFGLKGIRPTPNLFYDGTRVINLMYAPVDPTRRLAEGECITTLQDWTVQTVQFRSKDGAMKTAKGWLSPGTGIAHMRDGSGVPWVHACGNPIPSLQGQPMPFGKVECPQTRVETRTIEVPGPERIVDRPVGNDACPNIPGFQDRIPSNMTVDANGDCQPLMIGERRRVWPWIVGAVGAGILGYALSRGGDKDEDCDTCPGRIPKPAP